MNAPSPLLRQLPPAAVPVTIADWRAGLEATPATHDAFRADLAAYFGLPAAACHLASSGRTVIHTLLRGLAVDRPARRQVVIPAYTCPVVPKVTLDLGLEPIYVDIDLQTTAYQKACLANSVGEQTLAVFLVHPFGIPLPPDDVLAVAHAAGAVVIEDAAQALGARWNGRPVGLAGDYALFSLGPGKPLSTAGGGIAITGQADRIDDLARYWRALPPAAGHRSALALARQAAFGLAFHPRSWWAATRLGLHKLGNEEASWGYNLSDLTNAQSGIGRMLLPRLETINEGRRAIAARLVEAVQGAPFVEMLEVGEQATPIYLRLPLLARDFALREALFQAMWAAGIGAGRLYEQTLPAIFAPEQAGNFPGAEQFAQRLLTLPTHYRVTTDDLARMEDILAGL